MAVQATIYPVAAKDEVAGDSFQVETDHVSFVNHESYGAATTFGFSHGQSVLIVNLSNTVAVELEEL